MLSDGPKYAYKYLKLRKSCSFGNWSSSNGRECFIISTLQIYCNLFRWEGQRQRGGLAIKHHKLVQKCKIMDNRALQRETRCFTDNSHVISYHYSDGDKNLTNLHVKQWKHVVKLCSCCFQCFIGVHFSAVLVLSTTWNVPFCNNVDDVSIWWQIFKIFLLSPNRWYQFNFRINKIHFASVTWDVTFFSKSLPVSRSWLKRVSSLSSLLELHWIARRKLLWSGLVSVLYFIHINTNVHVLTST